MKSAEGGAMFSTKVLLATDGSAEAERAARMAKMVSENLEAELHVVHVAPMPDPKAWPEATLYDRNLLLQTREQAEIEGRPVLDMQMQYLEAVGAETAVPHLLVGRPDAEIVRLAEELGSGLIVIGSRGIGPVRRAVMGSVSGSVLRHAHCPVMVVRGKVEEEVTAVGPIVLAVDGSEEAQLATIAAAEFSQGHLRPGSTEADGRAREARGGRPRGDRRLQGRHLGAVASREEDDRDVPAPAFRVGQPVPRRASLEGNGGRAQGDERPDGQVTGGVKPR